MKNFIKLSLMISLIGSIFLFSSCTLPDDPIDGGTFSKTMQSLDGAWLTKYTRTFGQGCQNLAVQTCPAFLTNANNTAKVYYDFKDVSSLPQQSNIIAGKYRTRIVANTVSSITNPDQCDIGTCVQLEEGTFVFNTQNGQTGSLQLTNSQNGSVSEFGISLSGNGSLYDTMELWQDTVSGTNWWGASQVTGGSRAVFESKYRRNNVYRP